MIMFTTCNSNELEPIYINKFCEHVCTTNSLTSKPEALRITSY